MENSFITLQEVDFSYPYEKEKRLKNIDLSIPRSSFTVIVGPSGCGKSTLLKIIAEIIKPSNGSMEIHGTHSFVFQSGALLPWRTVKQNVFLGLEGKNISMTEKDKRVREAIRLMNMDQFEDEFPRNLSGGQRQRVGIARALVISPEILFLDEPFSALDPETTATLHKEILDIWKERKMTILMVSHLMSEAVLLADRVIIMENGTIKKEINITLPRPRSENDDDFRDVSEEVLLAL